MITSFPIEFGLTIFIISVSFVKNKRFSSPFIWTNVAICVMLNVKVIKMDSFKHSFKDTLKENAGLAVYNTGYEKCAEGYQWGPGVRDHYLLHYVSSGEGTYTCGGEEYILKEGDIFLIFPSQVVQYRAADENPWEYYWVGFNGADAHRMVAMTGFHLSEPVLRGADAKATKEALLRIYHSRGNTPAADVEMAGYLQLFLASLIRSRGNAPSIPGNRGYLAQALRYIQHNYAGAIGVSDIADFVGISRSQLYRAFETEFGQSPHEYLQKYRVSEACTLLRSGELTVAQVAGSVGFNDPLYFSRVFRRMKGYTPTAYQRKNAE